MKNFKIHLTLFMAFLLMVPFMVKARAALTDQKTQVETLVAAAVKYVQKNGQAKAMQAFNKTDGLFNKGDLYIFAYDYDGVSLANGGNPKLAGKNLLDYKDTHGKLVIQSLIAKAKKGGGWVKYYWPNPKTKKIMCKTAYVQPMNHDYFIASGYYTGK